MQLNPVAHYHAYSYDVAFVSSGNHTRMWCVGSIAAGYQYDDMQMHK